MSGTPIRLRETGRITPELAAEMTARSIARETAAREYRAYVQAAKVERRNRRHTPEGVCA